MAWQVLLLVEICTPDAHRGSSFSVKFNTHWNLEQSWAGLEGPWEGGTSWVWARGLSREGGVRCFSSFSSWRWGIPPWGGSSWWVVTGSLTSEPWSHWPLLSVRTSVRQWGYGGFGALSPESR